MTTLGEARMLRAAEGRAENNALDALTKSVVTRLLGNCEDERFKQIMSALIHHLHQFVRDVELTEEEWLSGIKFLTETGQKCTDKRQEFILLSDTLGASILTILLNQKKSSSSLEPDAAYTAATVQGPYYWENAPELPQGSDIGEDVDGEPTFYHGRVVDAKGDPIQGAVLDVWSGDGNGTYDMQIPGQTEMLARGKFRTNEKGEYSFWSIKPSYYPIPIDGPVGKMLKRAGAERHRPGHTHMKLCADGYNPLTTSLFVAGSPYLGTDAVFGDLSSLAIDYERKDPGVAPDGRVMQNAYYTATYDFMLARSRGG